MTVNGRADNGPIPGDLTSAREEWASSQELDTPGHFKSLNGAEVADSQRDQSYPAESSFLEPMNFNTLLTPGFGGRFYSMWDKGFIVLQLMPGFGSTSQAST